MRFPLSNLLFLHQFRWGNESRSSYERVLGFTSSLEIETQYTFLQAALFRSNHVEGKAMKAATSFLRSSLIFVAFVSTLLLVGCGKKDEQKQPAQTQQQQQTQILATLNNLQTAYGAELKRSLWYDRFAKQAQKENLGDIVVLFRALSRSEKVHADNDAKLLKSKGVDAITPAIDSVRPGKARQYLKQAQSSENVEELTYPGFIQKAQEEQFTEAVEQFKNQLAADERHGRLLKRAIEQEGSLPRVPYVMCPECGYIVGSDKIEECPICKTKKDKFQKL